MSLYVVSRSLDQLQAECFSKTRAIADSGTPFGNYYFHFQGAVKIGFNTKVVMTVYRNPVLKHVHTHNIHYKAIQIKDGTNTSFLETSKQLK